MRLLHLFSNYRWTGPAEPTVNLVAALRDAGCDVALAIARGPNPHRNGVLRAAAERGIAAHTGLHLNKHRHPLHNARDARHLRQWLAERPVDLIHANLRNAHLVAAKAAARLAPRPLIVRTCFAGDGPAGFWERRLLRRHTDGLIVVSDRARRRVVDQYGFPADRVWHVHTAIDLDRFDPDRLAPDARLARRAELGIPPDAFVVGIVARIQWRRRYHVFLEAIDLARRRLPALRGIIVGRGTHMRPIAVDPIRRMGLGDTIVLPGHHTGDDYVRTLGAMDAKVYLVPGTDGSCRAVREAMAMGVPVLAARRGMLPELVAHGDRGLVLDDTPQNLADAILALAGDPARRAAMAARARQFALDHFSLSSQASNVITIYQTLLERAAP